MSTSDAELDPTNETSQDQVTPDAETVIGNLTVEDDPEGTVDPADLAGTASDDDADVS
jgi:hypothetical protein